MTQILVEQRGIRYIRYLPRWDLRLQVGPWWSYRLMITALTLAVAIPAYFRPGVFNRLLSAPQLPLEEEVMIQKWEAVED